MFDRMLCIYNLVSFIYYKVGSVFVLQFYPIVSNSLIHKNSEPSVAISGVPLRSQLPSFPSVLQ